MRKSIDTVNHKVSDRAEDVLELVHSVMHSYRSLQYRFLRDGPHDITHMDGKVLGYFAVHPGATQSDLSQDSGRDKAQLARLIKGLRDQGLLHGQADENDRRNLRLSLTPDGQAVHRALKHQGRKLGELAVAGLSNAQRSQLGELLRKIKSNLDAQA